MGFCGHCAPAMALPGSNLRDAQIHVPTASEPVSEHVAFLGPIPTPHIGLTQLRVRFSICTAAWGPQAQVSA